MVTLSKLNPENNQEVFDFVVEKLYRQGKKSTALKENATDETETYCVYRAKDGCKCAVGHLIPYDLYTAKIEGHTVWSLMNDDIEEPKVKKVADYLKKFDINLLNLLQQAHDRSFSSVENFLQSILDREEDFNEVNVNVDLAEKFRVEYIQSQKDLQSQKT